MWKPGRVASINTDDDCRIHLSWIIQDFYSVTNSQERRWARSLILCKANPKIQTNLIGFVELLYKEKY